MPYKTLATGMDPFFFLPFASYYSSYNDNKARTAAINNGTPCLLILLIRVASNWNNIGIAGTAIGIAGTRTTTRAKTIVVRIIACLKTDSSMAKVGLPLTRY